MAACPASSILHVWLGEDLGDRFPGPRLARSSLRWLPGAIPVIRYGNSGQPVKVQRWTSPGLQPTHWRQKARMAAFLLLPAIPLR